MSYLLIRADSAEDSRWSGTNDIALDEGKFHLSVAQGSCLRVLEASPLSNDDSPLWIVFQGYIQTHALRNRPTSGRASNEDYLAEIEHRLRNSCSIQSLDSLEGNFTLIVVDPSNDYVRVQRDTLGGRTAYWADATGLTAISSSSARIAALPGVSDRTDSAWMASHFATPNIRPVGRSAFEAVYQLIPGEILEWRIGKRSARRHTLKSVSGADHRTEQDWIDDFSGRFESAVLGCIPAEKPPAIMLSGGLDSSPIAGVIGSIGGKIAESSTATSWALKAFPNCDESPWIKRIVEHTGIQDGIFEASSSLPFACLSTSQVALDAPYFNAFRPLINECYRQAKNRGHSVILNGHAGDAIYPPLRLLLKEQLYRRDFAGASDTFASAVQKHGLLRLNRDPSLRGLLSFLRKARPSSRRKRERAWLSERAKRILPDTDHWPPEADDHSWPDYARQLLGQRMGAGTALEQANCSPFGIERRDPFVNEQLVRLMLEMPFSMSWRNGISKWIMRETVRQKRLLPESLAKKPKTGDMTEFFATGFAEHREHIRSFLLERQQWHEWVEPKWVRRALVGETTPGVNGRLLVNQCIGYCLWLEKLKEEAISSA